MFITHYVYASGMVKIYGEGHQGSFPFMNNMIRNISFLTQSSYVWKENMALSVGLFKEEK